MNQQPPPPSPQPYGSPLYNGMPYAYIPQPSSHKQRPVWLGIGIGIGSFLLLCCGLGTIIAAAAGRHGTTTITTNNTPNGTTTPGSTGTHAASVGDTITINGYSCTLVSVTKLAADNYIHPKAGNQFIFVHIKLVNHTSAEVAYNPFQFHIKTGSGSITDEVIFPPGTYTANDELTSGKLAADGSVAGDIVFQVPIGDHQASLTWQPDYFANQGDNTWNLGL